MAPRPVNQPGEPPGGSKKALSRTERGAQVIVADRPPGSAPGSTLAPGAGGASSIALAQFAETVRVGPLPPPAEMREYEAVLPGFAERVLAQWEKDQEHARTMDRAAVGEHGRIVALEYSDRRWGQGFGFAIAVAAIIAAVVVAHFGHPVSGATLGIGAVGGIVATFVIGRKSGAGDGGVEESESPGAPQLAESDSRVAPPSTELKPSKGDKRTR